MRMFGKISGALLATAAAFSASSASAGVFFTSASATTTAFASAKIGAAPAVTQTQTAAGTITSINNLLRVATAAVAASNTVRASALSSANATFFSAGAGSFEDNSQTSVSSNRANGVTNARAGNYSFTYKFTTNSSENFQLIYALSENHGVVGNLAIAKLAGPGGAFTQSIPLNGSGTVNSVLGTGSYTLTFTSAFENVLSLSGAGALNGISGDRYDFSISSIPEPATWAMMLVGFGFVAGAARRRRSAGTSVLA